MKYLHQEVCCTRGNLNPIAEETSCTKKLCLQTTFRQSVLHQNLFPPQDSYTTSFYTRQLLHQRALHQIIRYCLHRKPLGLTPKTFSHEELCWPGETKFPRFLRHCFTFLRSLSVISFVRSTRRYMTEMTCQVRHVNIARVFPNNNSVCAMRFMRDFGRCTEPAPWSFASSVRWPKTPHPRSSPLSPPGVSPRFHRLKQGEPEKRMETLFQNQPKWSVLMHAFHCLHKEPFTAGNFYSRRSLHQKSYTPKNVYTKPSKNKGRVPPKSSYTSMFFYTKRFFTAKGFYTRLLLQQKA